MKRNIIIISLSICFLVSVKGQPDTSLYESGKVWIKLKEPLKNANKADFINKLDKTKLDNDLKKIKSVKKVFSISDESLNGIYELSFEYEKDLLKFFNKYDNSIEYTEYIPKFVGFNSLYIPNDYDSIYQWHIDRLHLREAWYLLLGVNKKTKVAFIDSGIDGDHEDIEDNITFIDTGADNNGEHGTKTAGFLGMVMNNDIGYCGVAGFNVELLIYTYTLWVDNIVRAAENGARVINMSFTGSCTYSSTVQSAINYAHSKGVLVVASAGNCNCSNCYSVQYPAAYNYVVAVAALSQTNTKVGNSSYYDEVDLSAPGYNLTSTTNSNSYYHTGCCTSLAAPQVAGVAALVFAVNPLFTPDEVECILKTSADDGIYDVPGNQPYIGKLGAGLINAEDAVIEAFSVTSDPTELDNEDLNGTYENFSVYITNSTVDNNTIIHTRDLLIDEVFEADAGVTLEIDVDFDPEICD